MSQSRLPGNGGHEVVDQAVHHELPGPVLDAGDELLEPVDRGRMALERIGGRVVQLRRVGELCEAPTSQGAHRVGTPATPLQLVAAALQHDGGVADLGRLSSQLMGPRADPRGVAVHVVLPLDHWRLPTRPAVKRPAGRPVQNR